VQRAPFEELHRIPRHAFGDALCHDSNDARVAHPAERIDLPPYADQQGLGRRVHGLDGHLLAGVDVLAPIDDAHAALVDEAVDAVRP
jgi:hypothetical protein